MAICPLRALSSNKLAHKLWAGLHIKVHTRVLKMEDMGYVWVQNLDSIHNKLVIEEF